MVVDIWCRNPGMMTVLNPLVEGEPAFREARRGTPPIAVHSISIEQVAGVRTRGLLRICVQNERTKELAVANEYQGNRYFIPAVYKRAKATFVNVGRKT